MKLLIASMIIIGAMSASALAGDIPTVGYAPPPPLPAASAAATDGDMGGGGFTQQITDEIVLAIFGYYAR